MTYPKVVSLFTILTFKVLLTFIQFIYFFRSVYHVQVYKLAYVD